MHTKNQKISILAVWVLILLFGIGIGFELGRNWGTPEGRDVSMVEQEAEDFVGEFKVARVIDGDTIEMEGGERVRYIGIDTPETVDPGMPVECFGPEASEKNKELVAGRTVRLAKDLTDRDKYNRLLRYVFVGDSFINLELVASGFAHSAAYPPDLKHQADFSASQTLAQSSHLGLWSACPQK